jgi:hypothetical protein
MKRQLLEIQLDYIYKSLLFERSSPGGLGGTPMKRQLLEIQRVKKLTLTPVYILYAVPSWVISSIRFDMPAIWFTLNAADLRSPIKRLLL